MNPDGIYTFKDVFTLAVSGAEIGCWKAVAAANVVTAMVTATVLMVEIYWCVLEKRKKRLIEIENYDLKSVIAAIKSQMSVRDQGTKEKRTKFYSHPSQIPAGQRPAWW